MDSLQSFIDLFIHLDKHLNTLIQIFGGWSYVILFLIIFCETGLVVTPFLPGDSLIFTAGAFAATGSLEFGLIFLIFCLAAILGDSTNYGIGFLMRSKILQEQNIRFIKNEYLERTNHFYERHGGKTIVLARFIPIIRTFAPFVAGIGKMTYWRFLFFSVFGSLIWISIFSYAGYLFGNIPFVKSHFSLVIVAIVCISLIPAALEIYQQSRHFKTEASKLKPNPEK